MSRATPPQATTLEVTISKIFPAGAGWQAASLYADKLGFAADSASFALTTGVGDGIAVAAGHTGYYAVGNRAEIIASTFTPSTRRLLSRRLISTQIKKATVDSSIDMGEQAGVGVWLGSAAVCSGALWQPLVNALQASEKLPFEAVAGMTAVGCGGAFLTGLRVGRAVMPWVPDCDSANFATDAYLSMAIGGASSFFVDTDVAYLGGEGNFLRPIVGVEDFDSDLLGVAKAGTSTALGFVAFQSVQNVTFKAGTAWLDPADEPVAVKEEVTGPQASFS